MTGLHRKCVVVVDELELKGTLWSCDKPAHVVFVSHKDDKYEHEYVGGVIPVDGFILFYWLTAGGCTAKDVS